jgi:5-(aminomethyl)-3-furanmethanol phosphate kinase
MISVIKLGGSLSTDPMLKLWLDMLVEHGSGKVVIVPGGGPYAEAVRQAQGHWRFNDSVAHPMALLAMEQYGLQLQGINPALAIADSIATIERALREKKVAIWLPSAMALAAPEISTTWDVTSDSLAAWLAKMIHAERLILVKSCSVKAEDSVAELARQGIVDASFEMLIRGVEFKIDVVNKTDVEAVKNGLAGS